MVDLGADAADLANTLPPNMNDLAVRLWPRAIRKLDDLVTTVGDMGTWSVPSRTSLSADDQRTKTYQTENLTGEHGTEAVPG